MPNTAPTLPPRFWHWPIRGQALDILTNKWPSKSKRWTKNREPSLDKNWPRSLFEERGNITREDREVRLIQCLDFGLTFFCQFSISSIGILAVLLAWSRLSVLYTSRARPQYWINLLNSIYAKTQLYWEFNGTRMEAVFCCSSSSGSLTPVQLTDFLFHPLCWEEVELGAVQRRI